MVEFQPSSTSPIKPLTIFHNRVSADLDKNDPHIVAAQIMRTAQYTQIDQARIQEVAELLNSQPISLPKWDFAPIYPTKGNTEELARYFLVLNAINYCYFHEAKSDFAGQRFSDGTLSGADLCAASLTREFDRIINPYQLALSNRIHLAEDTFKGTIPMPLLSQRAEHMREVGVFIGDLDMKNLGLTDFMRRMGGDAFEICKYLPMELPGFRDPFLKRAQLFIAMFYGRCRDNPDCPIDPNSLSKLSIFADYRVPQTFIGAGIIIPNAELEAILEAGTEIPEGSLMEQELRAGPVLAGKMIIDAMNQSRDVPVNALHLDYLAWKAARDMEKGKAIAGLFVRPMPKHHKTISVKY